MNYKRDNLTQYFRDSEKEDKLLGVEIENLVLDEEYRWVPYEQIRRILAECVEDGWDPVWIDGVLLGAEKGEWAISLEPGSQFELSLRPKEKLKEIRREYRRFMRELLPRIHERGLRLYSIGYQPLSALSDITLIEKKRYAWMYEHFAALGGIGHHMMKATAATQISVDFKSEKDFAAKLRLAGLLSPYLSLLFDNSSLREGKPMEGRLWRREIWQGTDPDRTGDIPGSLEPGFTYQRLVDGLLDKTPILYRKDAALHHAQGKRIRDLLGEQVEEEDWKHLLSMFFFDTRVKSYLEIRMMDSLPLYYLLSAAAIVKGLMYAKDAREEAASLLTYERKKGGVTERIRKEGVSGQTREVLRELVKIAGKTLGKEAKYLAGAVEIIENGRNLSDEIRQCYANEGLSALRRREVRLESL